MGRGEKKMVLKLSEPMSKKKLGKQSKLSHFSFQNCLLFAMHTSFLPNQEPSYRLHEYFDKGL